MHRSGTSVAARALVSLGISLGDPDGLQPPGKDNPRGYWENRYVKELDDEILAACGGAWDVPPVLDPGWEHDTALDPFRDRAHAILAEWFPPGVPIGWKDPRLCLLLPFWRTVVPVDTTVLVVRHPLEVADSLAARNGMARPEAALLWLRYLLAAARNDPSHLLVHHDALYDDLDGVLAAMSDHLGVDPAPPDLVAELRDHFDPGLRHHVAAPAPAGDNPLVAMALAVWADGRVDVDALDPALTDAVVRGWLRPPADAEALMAARAEAVAFEEEIRRRNRRDRAAASGAPPA
jgi:hypothetical protein